MNKRNINFNTLGISLVFHKKTIQYVFCSSKHLAVLAFLFLFHISQECYICDFTCNINFRSNLRFAFSLFPFTTTVSLKIAKGLFIYLLTFHEICFFFIFSYCFQLPFFLLAPFYFKRTEGWPWWLCECTIHTFMK